MKRIAIQQDLEELKENLEELGYEVVDFNDQGPVDAIIYTYDHTGIANLNNEENSNQYGAILINATHRSLEEIIYIIEKRRYGGLF